MNILLSKIPGKTLSKILSKALSKTRSVVLTLSLIGLTATPAAFGQAFLEPVRAQPSDDFLNSAQSQPVPLPANSYYSPNPNKSAVAGVNQPAYSEPHVCDFRTIANLTSMAQPLSSNFSPLPFGCPFTEASRAQIEQEASAYIQASVNGGNGNPRGAQVLARDASLDSAIDNNSSELGGHFAALKAEDQLISQQEQFMIRANGGRDISQLEQRQLNEEENQLSRQIRRDSRVR